MNAIVVRSPRSLSKPRQCEIVRYSPAAAAVFTGVATAVVQGIRGATALAARAKDAAVTHQRRARWVHATQVQESPPPAPPAPLAEPRRVKVEKFLDIFD